jgi:glycosyltransferase involved in cell wall biosynthesis
LPAARLMVAPTPVAPEFRCEPDTVADRTASKLLGNAIDQTILLHVGSTIPRKRIDVLLKVFAGVRRSLPNTRLVRVGGPFNQQQTALLRSLSLQDAVLQLPELPRNVLAAVYRKARLLLLPSEREGFGLPLLEAMACGTLALASDLPVLRELGRDAVEYCTVGDIEQWTDRILALLGACDQVPASWSQRRQQAIELASQLDCRSYGKKMLNVYMKVLNWPADRITATIESSTI